MATHTSSLEHVRSSAGKTLHQLLDFVKRHSNVILLILSIVLIVLAVIRVNQLVTSTFKHEFSCKHLIGETLGTNIFCDGVSIKIGGWDIPIIGTIPTWTIPVLPGLNPIDKPLEAIRKFVAWNIVLAFAVVSLVLAFIISKINSFVKLLMTPEGRKSVLTSISLCLLFFAIFSSLFYFGVVVPSLGK